jgi:hypothetical protein
LCGAKNGNAIVVNVEGMTITRPDDLHTADRTLETCAVYYYTVTEDRARFGHTEYIEDILI